MKFGRNVLGLSLLAVALSAATARAEGPTEQSADGVAKLGVRAPAQNPDSGAASESTLADHPDGHHGHHRHHPKPKPAPTPKPEPPHTKSSLVADHPDGHHGHHRHHPKPKPGPTPKPEPPHTQSSLVADHPNGHHGHHRHHPKPKPGPTPKPEPPHTKSSLVADHPNGHHGHHRHHPKPKPGPTPKPEPPHTKSSLVADHPNGHHGHHRHHPKPKPGPTPKPEPPHTKSSLVADHPLRQGARQRGCCDRAAARTARGDARGTRSVRRGRRVRALAQVHGRAACASSPGGARDPADRRAGARGTNEDPRCARNAQQTGDRQQIREKARADLKALRERTLLQIAPQAQGLVALLTPEQRAQIQERAQKHGRTVDDQKLTKRFAMLLSRPGAASFLERHNRR